MLVRGRVLRRRQLLQPGECECECEWLRHPLIVAHCRRQLDVADPAAAALDLQLALDTHVFCSVHSLDMSLVDIDHMYVRYLYDSSVLRQVTFTTTIALRRF